MADYMQKVSALTSAALTEYLTNRQEGRLVEFLATDPTDFTTAPEQIWVNTTEDVLKYSFDGVITEVSLSDTYFNVKGYGLKGDGVTDDYTALNTLINTTINGVKATIIFPVGTYKISTSITIPSNVSLYFVNGAMLSPDSGDTVTINGPIEAGLWQIFTGNGTISGSMKVDQVYPQWWGAKGDGIADDTARFQLSLDYCATNTRLLFVPKGEYLVGILNVSCSILGYDAVFLPNANGISVINLQTERLEVIGFRINTNGKTGISGVTVNYSNNLIRDVLCNGLSKGFVIKSWQTYLDNCRSINGEIGVYGYGANDTTEINDLKIIGGSYSDNSQWAIRLGDDTPSDATTNGDPHGVSILLQGFACDHSSIKIDYCWNINIKNVHIESITYNNFIEIGMSTSFGGELKGVTIENCYLANGENGIELNPLNVENVTIRGNVFKDITYKGIYGLHPNHMTLIENNSFDKMNGVTPVEIATYPDGFFPAIRQVNISPSTKSTIPGVIVSGIGTYKADDSMTSPIGRFTTDDVIYGAKKYICTSPTVGYGKINGAVALAGTVSGNTFTFSIRANSEQFESGDCITITNNPNAQYVKSVDYKNGILSFDYGTVNGSQTISHVAPVFNTINRDITSVRSVTPTKILYITRSGFLTVKADSDSRLESTKLFYIARTNDISYIPNYYQTTVYSLLNGSFAISIALNVQPDFSCEVVITASGESDINMSYIFSDLI